jgi:hypothetical protein
VELSIINYQINKMVEDQQVWGKPLPEVVLARQLILSFCPTSKTEILPAKLPSIMLLITLNKIQQSTLNHSAKSKNLPI